MVRDPGAVTWVPASRTAAFAMRSALRSLRADRECAELPTHAVTPKLAVAVWLDEMLRGSVTFLPGAEPDVAELDRAGPDVAEALELFAARGWLDHPASFHAAPPPPEPVSSADRAILGVRYREVRFESGFEPPAGLPGAQLGGGDGRPDVHAYVLEHRGEPRPWLVQLHGWMMGSPLDLVVMRSLALHRRLGFNVIHPVAPLHGPRRTGRYSGHGMFTTDYVANVTAMAQAVWDVRRCIAYARASGAPSVAVHGISLGGFLTALLAGLDPDLDAVVAGAPPASIDQLLAKEWSAPTRKLLQERGLLGAPLEAVHRVVSPLALAPVVAPERRFIYAAIGDRATTARQAYQLWLHWQRPEILWHHGSHLTLFGRDVVRFVEAAVTSTVA